MNERRKAKRKYMVFFGRVSDRNTAQVLGNVADITSAGAMVISGHPLALDQEYQMRLDLPEHIFGIDHLDFDARSIWGAPDIDPTYFNTGFEIINITPEKSVVIEKIIQEYGIRG
jgi:hypothetical protein